MVKTQLVRLVPQGEDAVLDSFDGWYAREHPRLVTSLLLVTGDVHVAAECVDEAFARALEQWDRVSVMDSPAGWTYKVALHHARRSARRRSMERHLLFRHERPVDVPAPAGEIWLLLAQLPRRQREVVVLRHIADMTEADIGEVLGISRSTVSSTLADAHARLGQVLDEKPHEENHDV
jgi:RNA polymerase sigma-70 factor (ECF subfamily)